MMTAARFENNKGVVFDIYMADSDLKLQEFNLFENIWRETLLVNSIKDPRVAPILSFG